MNKFDELLVNIQATDNSTPLITIICFILTAICAMALKHVYENRSTSLSSKYQLSNIIPIPFIYEGELDIKSQYGDFSSEEAFGYSFFGNLGMEIGEWEMLLGLRWSKVKFSDIAFL